MLRVDADWQRQWGDTDVCMGIWGRERVSNMKRCESELVPHWRSRSMASHLAWPAAPRTSQWGPGSSTTSPGDGPGSPGSTREWGGRPRLGSPRSDPMKGCNDAGALADKWLQLGLIGRNSEKSVPYNY